MAGLAEEESLDDQKKGPVVYQEQKSFVGELSIITVYDNQEQKKVTFEVYGCDTSDILRVQYNYIEFDAFFRFNAELMNPNRREGRYHWIAERLEVQADGAGGRKLGLASEPTPELPEVPLYEKRKIPTGRMNYQERQRLRESMDQLDIKRNEAISKKRAVSKAKFLVKIAEQKDEHLKRLGLRGEKIAREREERWAMKETERTQELEAHLEVEARIAVRLANVETKEENTDERDAKDIRDMHARYKAKEKIRQEAVDEARKERAKGKKVAAKEEKETLEKAKKLSEMREEAWRQRELRVQKKRDVWLDELRKENEVTERDAKLVAEKKLEFIKDLHIERQKVFAEQNEKSKRREKEIEETKAVTEEEVPPEPVAEGEEAKPVATKPAAKGKKTKKTEESKKESKKADGAIIDGVEHRMRAEIQKQKELNALEQIRLAKFEDKLKTGILKEAENAKRLRSQKREADAQNRAQQDQKAVIVAQRKDENQKELDRKTNELERRENLRDENIRAKALARVTTNDCQKDFKKGEPAIEEESDPVPAEA